MNLMKKATSVIQSLFSTSKNTPSNPQEMAVENSSGLVLNDQMENGLDSIKKNSQRSVPSTSIRYTSEPNTITIHMTLTALPSRETYSSITTPIFSVNEITVGSSGVNVLTSSLPWTSRIPQARNQITHPS